MYALLFLYKDNTRLAPGNGGARLCAGWCCHPHSCVLLWLSKIQTHLFQWCRAQWHLQCTCVFVKFLILLLTSASQDDGVRVTYIVSLCDAEHRIVWLSLLFGYKVIIQAIGIYLAFRIRKVKVINIQVLENVYTNMHMYTCFLFSIFLFLALSSTSLTPLSPPLITVDETPQWLSGGFSHLVHCLHHTGCSHHFFFHLSGPPECIWHDLWNWYHSLLNCGSDCGLLHKGTLLVHMYWQYWGLY